MKIVIGNNLSICDSFNTMEQFGNCTILGSPYLAYMIINIWIICGIYMNGINIKLLPLWILFIICCYYIPNIGYLFESLLKNGCKYYLEYDAYNPSCIGNFIMMIGVTYLVIVLILVLLYGCYWCISNTYIKMHQIIEEVDLEVNKLNE
jgi:hypothetical protein